MRGKLGPLRRGRTRQPSRRVPPSPGMGCEQRTNRRVVVQEGQPAASPSGIQDLGYISGALWPLSPEPNCPASRWAGPSRGHPVPPSRARWPLSPTTLLTIHHPNCPIKGQAGPSGGQPAAHQQCLPSSQLAGVRSSSRRSSLWSALSHTPTLAPGCTLRGCWSGSGKRSGSGRSRPAPTPTPNTKRAAPSPPRSPNWPKHTLGGRWRG
mmetsp:Transcript_150333/g.262688  ORF Transcript_150333/g.262688 Transcript_150333/m.262688 type:complete len:209 (+) Transcript_150333:372-998(+)